MSEESRLVNSELAQETVVPEKQPATNSSDREDVDVGGASAEDAGNPAEKKKRSKRAKLKRALGAGSKDKADASSKPSSQITSDMVEQLLEMNPSLRSEVAGLDKEKAAEKLKTLEAADLMTGMSLSNKNQKDMASYKFWKTQPVPRFDEQVKVSEEGPIKKVDRATVPKQPPRMLEGFEWVTMDLMEEKQIEEVYELLLGHYVEDDDAKFRFNYSFSFLNWALKSPGWRPDWHVGVRASKSQKLVAFISGVPVNLRVREKVVTCSEINFLCIHKKLRSKRLAPVLIQEITRRNYVHGIFQGLYTGGIVLPKPASSCRYFHRSLDWLKLHEVGFTHLPSNSTKARQLTRFRLPTTTDTPGLRPMTTKDVPGVHDLLSRYLARFKMSPEFTTEEITHWLVHDESAAEQVIWSYVVDDPSGIEGKISDFFSFYCLESQVIGNQKHENVKAAYLFYYATDTAFVEGEKGLKERLNQLIADALVVAKKYNFDVFNALTLLDNPLFLEQQKFGAGDGQLHYYLYNYRTAPIYGGVDASNNVDPSKRGGVGVVML